MEKQRDDSVLHVSQETGYRLNVYAAKMRTTKKEVADTVLKKFLDREERKEQ